MRRLAIACLLASSTAIASPTLDRGIRLYEQKDFYSASIEFAKVTSGETGDDAVGKQRAEFFLGKTMFAAGYPAVALAYFDRITQAGASHAFFSATLKWLIVAIDRASGPTSQLRPYLDDPDLELRLDTDARELLTFELGRDAAIQGDLDEAETRLKAVAGSSRWGAQARLVLARARFRAKDIAGGIAAAEHVSTDPVLAAEAVRLIADAARRNGEPAAAVAALRRFAATETPAAWFAAFELSRIAVEDAGTAPGLAKLRATTFAAAVTVATCQTGNTEDTFAATLPVIRTAQAAVRKLVAFDDAAELYEAITKHDAELPPLVRLALDDADTHESTAYAAELRRELGVLYTADKAWQTTQVAAEVLQELTVQSAIAAADTGKRYHARLAELATELDRIEKVLIQPVVLAAGSTVTPGAGFVVSDAACGHPVIARSNAVPVVQGHGCAGCASGGDASWLVVALIALRPSRRRTAS